MNKQISKLYNRIHINSINMSDQGILSSGGLGFSIKHAPMTVEVSYVDGEKCNIVNGFSPDRVESIISTLHTRYNIPQKGWQVNVDQLLRPHIGLGSTTQIEAQILMSCFSIALAKNPSYQDFISTAIGIESGIGLKCFLKNGFHIDFGYWSNRDKITKINSAEAVTKSLYFRLPDEWKVILIVPKEFTSISGSIEQRFWDKILPVDASEAYKISFYTLMGVIPSILESNFTNFIESLKSVTHYGTKPFEVTLNQNYINPVYEDVNEVFGFCGLSSLGPTCYTFIENSNDWSRQINRLKEKHQNFQFIITELVYE